MSSTAARSLGRNPALAAALLMLAATSTATFAGTFAGDMEHPRAPGQPLEVKLAPWQRLDHKGERAFEGEDEPIELMGLAPAQMADRLGIRKWTCVQSPNLVVFSTLKGVRINHRDSAFAEADMERLRGMFPDFKPGGQATFCDARMRTHLYQVRLERIYAHFSALMANEEDYLGMGGRYEVYLFEEPDQFKGFVDEFIGERGKVQFVSVYHVPGDGNHMVYAAAQKFFKGGDAQLHNCTANNVGQQFCKGYRNYRTDVWAWLEEGVGHYYERLESEKYNYFAVSGGDPPADFVRGNWRKKIRHAVYRGKDPSFGTFCETLRPQELGGYERAISWSLVEWMIKTDPVRFARLCAEASDGDRKPGSSDAITTVYGVTPYVLHERWRKYVLKEYK